MKPKIKKLIPFVGLVALTALSTIGIMKKDAIAYKIYQKSYKHQIKKENITPYNQESTVDGFVILLFWLGAALMILGWGQMTNVIEYLLQLSQEQKDMFTSMSQRVDDMEDHVKVIMIRIQEIYDKLERMEQYNDNRDFRRWWQVYTFILYSL